MPFRCFKCQILGSVKHPAIRAVEKRHLLCGPLTLNRVSITENLGERHLAGLVAAAQAAGSEFASVLQQRVDRHALGCHLCRAPCAPKVSRFSTAAAWSGHSQRCEALSALGSLQTLEEQATPPCSNRPSRPLSVLTRRTVMAGLSGMSRDATRRPSATDGPVQLRRRRSALTVTVGVPTGIHASYGSCRPAQSVQSKHGPGTLALRSFSAAAVPKSVAKAAPPRQPAGPVQ